MQSWKPLALLMISAAFTGCASIPKPLAGDYPGITPEAVSDTNVGVPVRWGGTIIATNTKQDKTCIEVLGRELDYQARPIFDDTSEGRFIACKNGFQDPQIFRQGREVTITGRVDNLETREVGEYEYRYPVVATDVLYLWPERFALDGYGYGPNYAFYGGPFFYPFSRGYFFNGFGYPYGFRSRFFLGSRYGFGFGHGFGFGRGFYGHRRGFYGGRRFHSGRAFRGSSRGFRGARGFRSSGRSGRSFGGPTRRK